MRIKIENNENSDFDFFRFVPSSSNQKEKEDVNKEEKRSLTRKKIKLVIAKYFKKNPKNKKEGVLESNKGSTN